MASIKKSLSLLVLITTGCYDPPPISKPLYDVKPEKPVYIDNYEITSENKGTLRLLTLKKFNGTVIRFYDDFRISGFNPRYSHPDNKDIFEIEHPGMEKRTYDPSSLNEDNQPVYDAAIKLYDHITQKIAESNRSPEVKEDLETLHFNSKD